MFNHNMKKKIVLLLIFIVFFVISSYSEERYISIDYYPQSDELYILDFVEVIIKKAELNEIEFTIHKSLLPFQETLNADIVAVKKENQYSFNFLDSFGNNVCGYLKYINLNLIELYIDCDSFSEEGKDIARLYGDKYLLIQTVENFDPEKIYNLF